ncbi:uncharacterized protein KY384_000662 [Bacidia gigantensis]|uniref:uncharacterized protein n=1 Tax=Bacidia gigantensis TaxID=2732470 RepID=UPI001D05517A|nr:uncharacterized protein KY384_000662 [Bacidia gigantensis]KAG8525900.1 hypothetical protein KY384_000662 [Bacidia gigantensis]
MLSRRSSRTSIKLGGPKSTSSLRPYRADGQYAGFKDEDTAYNSAVTAAGVAFDRTKEHKHGISIQGAHHMPTEPENKPNINRRKSIRFAGPSAVPTRNQSITRRSARSFRPSASPRDSSLQTDRLPADAGKSAVQSFETASLDDEESTEQNVVLKPSSYRKLKKARSMFAPGQVSSAALPRINEKAGRHFRRQSARSSESLEESKTLPDRRLRKSYSFLRRVADNLPTTPQQDPQSDEAVRLARDEYLRQLQQQRLKEQSSLLNLAKRNGRRKPFRRNLRTSGANPYGSPVASSITDCEQSKSVRFGDRTRRFSVIVKNGFKKVFSRPPGNTTSIPAQHLDASRAYFGNTQAHMQHADQFYPPIPSPDAELLQRVKSRESVGHPSPQLVGEDSSARSVASLEDTTRDKSRVTSWTDSTAANTIHMPGKGGRKRLSVIKEDGGPHQPSSSAIVFERVDTGYSAFSQPFRQSGGRAPEPQRVFSALQREIGKKDSMPQLDESDLEGESAWHPQRTITPQHSYPDLPLYRGSHKDHPEIARQLTPQDIATLNELDVPNRPRYESGSGFFPVYKRIEQTQSTSPYRKALQLSGANDGNATSNGDLLHHLRQPFAGANRQVSQNSGSESVYSRASNGYKPYASISTPSLIKSDTNSEPGTAVVISSESRMYSRSVDPFRQYREISDKSTKSSSEWKEKLASEIASLDRSSYEDDKIYDALPVARRGHKRENAQIDNVSSLTAGVEPHLPSGRAVRDMGFTPPVMQNGRSRPRRDRSPLKDITPPKVVNMIRQNENTPPSGKSNHQGSSANLAQRSSQSSLTPRKENVKDYISPLNRSGLDRAEPHRHLHSKSSPYVHSEPESLPDLGVMVGYRTNDKAVRGLAGLVTPKRGFVSTTTTPDMQFSQELLIERFLKNRSKAYGTGEEDTKDAAFL